MKIQIESTDRLTELSGTPVRAWHGVTEDGIQCVVFVAMIAVREDVDNDRFQRELIEKLPPGRAVPLRMIL